MNAPDVPVPRLPLPEAPPEAWEPLLRLARLARRPLERFLHIQAASGIVLLIAAGIALIWANSPWAATYRALWHTPLGIRLGTFYFERSLEWFVNDALMVVFFFVVGLEIRRELHHGELSQWRRAVLPASAALGGMLAPALLYGLIAGQPPTRSGWGVPMATDIAFAVGVLTLLGPRVPAALRVLLLALAVIDDLGAIVVIALFYSSGLSLLGLAIFGAGMAGIFTMQRLGIRQKLLYIAPAILAWAGIYASGVHPTIAGVLIGLVTPVRAWLGPDGFIQGLKDQLALLAQKSPQNLSSDEFSATLRQVSIVRREALSPAESLIETLHPWVAFAIMPLFALANAGVHIDGLTFDANATRVVLGASFGLVLGKPLGILVLSAFFLRLGIATLPRGLSTRHLLVLGVVAGIGFTMALFVAQLAFADAHLLAAAKLGVLAGSVVAGAISWLLGRCLLKATQDALAAQTADEAEGSTER